MSKLKVLSTGTIASRDAVVGIGLNPTNDPGLKRMVDALRVQQPDEPQSWLNIEANTRWVMIEFGPVGKAADLRNPFHSIVPFDAREYQVEEYPYNLHKEWVKVQEAATKLKLSASTVRRTIKQREPEHGANLVRRTVGGHRRINLKLLRNMV